MVHVHLGHIDLLDHFHNSSINLIHLHFLDLNIRLSLVKSNDITPVNNNVRIPNKAESRRHNLGYPYEQLIHIIIIPHFLC